MKIKSIVSLIERSIKFSFVIDTEDFDFTIISGKSYEIMRGN